MITLKKSQVWVNAEANSSSPETQGFIPVYFTKRDSQINAAAVGWNKSDVQRVAIDKGVCRQGWAIVNTLCGEYQVFKIGGESETFTWSGGQQQ